MHGLRSQPFSQFSGQWSNLYWKGLGKHEMDVKSCFKKGYVIVSFFAAVWLWEISFVLQNALYSNKYLVIIVSAWLRNQSLRSWVSQFDKIIPLCTNSFYDNNRLSYIQISMKDRFIFHFSKTNPNSTS